MSASKRGRQNRRKGAQGERELCAIFNEKLGLNVKRRLGQARDSGCDIDLPGFTVEAKRRKKIAGLYEWLEQAYYASACPVTGTGGTPVVMVRADGGQWLAVMDLHDWLKIAREEVARAEK